MTETVQPQRTMGNTILETVPTLDRIDAVEDFRFPNLGEFVLESFRTADGIEVEFTEPLVLVPTLTESGRYLTLQEEHLGIDVIAQTREELEEELHAELRMLWEQSRMSDDELGTVFQKQKKNFLAAIKEGNDGNS